MFALFTGYSVIPNPAGSAGCTREGVVVMAHLRRLVDVRTGDEFDQPVPFGLVYPVCTADGSAPPSQRGRTWEHLVASDRELRQVS